MINNNTPGSRDHENFFRHNLMQASENGNMSNSILNATEKNKQKRNHRKEQIETNMSATNDEFKKSYLQFTAHEMIDADS